jgi:hypothetical protein
MEHIEVKLSTKVPSSTLNYRFRFLSQRWRFFNTGFGSMKIRGMKVEDPVLSSEPELHNGHEKENVIKCSIIVNIEERRYGEYEETIEVATIAPDTLDSITTHEIQDSENSMNPACKHKERYAYEGNNNSIEHDLMCLRIFSTAQTSHKEIADPLLSRFNHQQNKRITYQPSPPPQTMPSSILHKGRPRGRRQLQAQ